MSLIRFSRSTTAIGIGCSRLLRTRIPINTRGSIHQMHRYYDVTLPGETYMSIQNGGAVSEFGKPDSFRQGAQKPVIFDEIEYEGKDNTRSWAHLAPEDMVYRFWLGIVAGTYVTHGETFYSSPGVAWISRGGKLMGQSPGAWIAFLKSILATLPMEGMIPIQPAGHDDWDDRESGRVLLDLFWESGADGVGFQSAGGEIREAGDEIPD